MTLKEILEKFNMAIRAEQIAKLDRYYELLVEWNEKMNLTAITDYNEVVIKHFADSIIGLPYFSGKCLDVGAGAGFPSVPLVIMGVNNFLCADSLEKRIKFLNEVKNELQLNFDTIHIRAEDMGKGAYRESFDTVTARAVANTVTLSEYLLPLVKVGGKAVLYKGGDIDEEIDQARYAIGLLGGKIDKIERYEFMGLKRSLVIISKVKHTPNAYPRGGNKPKSQPLIN